MTKELKFKRGPLRTVRAEPEATKEGLGAANKELRAANARLKAKLDDMSRANSDLQNLMAASDYGTMFLDHDLRIKRFSARLAELFGMTRADEGRPVSDFARQFNYDGLADDVRSVHAELASVCREIRTHAGLWFEVRMRPFRTVDGEIDGVVMTFVDMTERRNFEEALRDNERQLRQQQRLIDLSHEPIIVWDFDCGIIEWNHGCEEAFGYSQQEALGTAKEQLLRTQVPGSSFDEVKQQLQARGQWSGDVRHLTKDGRTLTMETRLDLETIDGRRLVLETMRDITDRKAWQDRQKLLLRELTHRVKNALAVVQSIAQQTLRNSDTAEDFVRSFEGRLVAMARAHDLLVQSVWEGADLASMARIQLEPHALKGAKRIRIAGPPVSLPRDLATSFGLILHELATNAAKFGSLSRRNGKVDVTWTVTEGGDDRRLSVVWQETAGPKVHEPAHESFGSRLIENGIPGAQVRREFRPDGFVCTIDMAMPQEQQNATELQTG